MDKQMTLIHAGFPGTTINHTENQQELIDHRHERDEPDMKLKQNPIQLARWKQCVLHQRIWPYKCLPIAGKSLCRSSPKKLS